MTYILHLLSFFSIDQMDTKDITEIFKTFLTEKKIDNLIQSTDKGETLYIVTNHLLPEKIESKAFDQQIQFVSSFSDIAVENDNVIFIEEFSMSSKKAKIECTYKGNKIEMRQSKINGTWKAIKSKVVKNEEDKGVKVTYEKSKF